MSQMKRIYDIYYVFRREFYTVFRDHAVIVFFILLTLAYPLVYTYIYSDEVVRDVPVAVVDHSNSSLSREFIRDWGASPNVRIVAHCSDLEQAKILMHEKKIYGILEVPSDFSKSVARGDQAHVALFCDMGALLNYKALLQAASDVAIGMSREIQVEGVPYASRIQQEITTSPVEIAEVKMFNPQSGFASFIIPAVLVLVIQQSLLLGVGTIAGTARDRSRKKWMIPDNRHYRRAWCIVLGKALLYIPIYFVMGYWVFFIVPRIFGLTQIGNPELKSAIRHTVSARISLGNRITITPALNYVHDEISELYIEKGHKLYRSFCNINTREYSLQITYDQPFGNYIRFKNNVTYYLGEALNAEIRTRPDGWLANSEIS